MAIAGDHFTVTLSETHLDWGRVRNATNRVPIQGEGFIPIPRHIARRIGLFNGNHTCRQNQLGINLFNCRSADGFFAGQLKSQGGSYKGDIFAKNFAGNRDLKALGRWYVQCNARPGDTVEVTWTTPTDITICHIPS
ncbi:MAG: hypothetical protein AB9883_01005 [Acidaminococcaceae bacterium]